MFNANCINCFRGQGLAVCNWSGQRAQERFVCWGKVCSTSIWRKSKSFSLEDWIDTLGKTQHPQQRPSHGKWYLFLLMGKNRRRLLCWRWACCKRKFWERPPCRRDLHSPYFTWCFCMAFAVFCLLHSHSLLCAAVCVYARERRAVVPRCKTKPCI